MQIFGALEEWQDVLSLQVWADPSRNPGSATV